MYIGKQPVVGNFQVCDAISVVNGQAAYTMQVSSTNVNPESANHMLVSLNGVLQKPGSSFTISGATLTFASNLATGDVIDFVMLLGNVLDLGTPSDGTVTNAKLAQDIISGETELASAPADTDEFLVSDAGTLKRIDYSLIKSANTPAFMASQSGDQSLSHNTTTKIAFSNQVIDTDDTYDHSSNYRFTPAVVGKYMLGFGGWLYSSGSNLEDISFYLYKNGSDITNTMYKNTNGRAERTNLVFHTIINITSTSDYYEVYVNQNSNGSAAATFSGSGNSANFRNYFYAYKIIT